MGSRATAAVVVLSISLSGALCPLGLCCVHPEEDQHDQEGVSQVTPAPPAHHAGTSERDGETANLVLDDGCSSTNCTAEQVAVLQKVLPEDKPTQNESIIAQASTELLIHDQAPMMISGPTSSHPPPGMEPCSSILRV